MATFEGRVTPGSTLIHDMEGAHMTLVNKLSLKSQRYNAKLLKCVPDGQNPLGLVNRMRYFMQSFLRVHPGCGYESARGQA